MTGRLPGHMAFHALLRAVFFRYVAVEAQSVQSLVPIVADVAFRADFLPLGIVLLMVTRGAIEALRRMGLVRHHDRAHVRLQRRHAVRGLSECGYLGYSHFVGDAVPLGPGIHIAADGREKHGSGNDDRK